MDRKEIFEAIDIEREYQRLRWGEDINGTVIESYKPVECYLVYMKAYLDEAMEEITTDSGYFRALHTVFKLMALASVALEQNGVPRTDRARGMTVINARDNIARTLNPDAAPAPLGHNFR